MVMKTTPIHYGLLLTVITLILFFTVYFFFIGFEYYMISIKVNFFVLPAIYTFTAIIFLYKKTNIEKLSFVKSFQYSFITMFIAGTVSYAFISFFFNYAAQDAQLLLYHQGLEQLLNSLRSEYNTIKNPTNEITFRYNEYVKMLTFKIANKEQLFSFKNSFIILGFLYLFYITISVLLSIFFRTRIPKCSSL